ncbi:prepilin peptidase [Sphingobium fuliginis]|uniref:prepilin peptidase n=1 Tax=Sphingobium fuliginis (strain ATCC 27551) TaxID=336203 RepID=UPI00065C6FE4|nr:prepilin peptidase [Sphingobium fuliginis]
MPGVQLIAISTLILILLPIIVLEWEQRNVPNWLYLLLGAAGIAFTLTSRGLGTAIASLAAGIAILLLLAGGIAYMRRSWKLRLLSGGQIKLLAAGAAWLGPSGAVLMLSLVILLFVISVVFLRIRKKAVLRPDSEAIAAIAILIVQVHQGLAT